MMFNGNNSSDHMSEMSSSCVSLSLSSACTGMFCGGVQGIRGGVVSSLLISGK